MRSDLTFRLEKGAAAGISLQVWCVDLCRVHSSLGRSDKMAELWTGLILPVFVGRICHDFLPNVKPYFNLPAHTVEFVDQLHQAALRIFVRG